MGEFLHHLKHLDSDASPKESSALFHGFKVVREADIATHSMPPIPNQKGSMAVGQNQWCHFGVGALAIVVYFSGDWAFHWGYEIRILAHVHVHPELLQLRKAPSPGFRPCFGWFLAVWGEGSSGSRGMNGHIRSVGFPSPDQSKQWFPMVSKWCEMDFATTHSRVPIFAAYPV